MKVFDRAWMVLLGLFGLFASVAQAAMEEGAATVLEPTVSIVWVVVFLVLFVAICAWIGIAIWRNERKQRAASADRARA